MSYSSRYINIIDLEATCREDKQWPPDQEQEVIEIGLAVVDTTSKEIEETVSFLIEPICGEVTDFCTELTSLTEPQLRKHGMTLGSACRRLKDKYQSHQRPWGSWGNWDLNRFQKDCQMKGVGYPMNTTHFNIKTLFAMGHGLGNEMGLGSACNYAMDGFEGTHHRGVDDARNTAMLFIDLFS